MKRPVQQMLADRLRRIHLLSHGFTTWHWLTLRDREKLDIHTRNTEKRSIEKYWLTVRYTI